MDPLRDLVTQLDPNRPGLVKFPTMVFRQGKVTATAAGPPKTVSVQIGGSTTTITGIRYLASYTPAVDDSVFMIQNGPDLIVLGKLA